MKKAEFKKAVAEKLEITQVEAEDVINGVFEVVEEGLLTAGSVPVGNIGKLEVVERAARKGHNPSTGEKIDIPARNAVRYKANKYVRELVQ